MKRLKMINGMKILHRYSLALLFSVLLFGLTSIGCVLLMSGLFQLPDPLVGGFMVYPSGTGAITVPFSTFGDWFALAAGTINEGLMGNVIDLFAKVGITLPNLSSNGYAAIETVNAMKAMFAGMGDTLAKILAYVIIWLVALLHLTLLILAVLGALMILIYILTGRLISFKSPLRSTWVFFGVLLVTEAAGFGLQCIYLNQAVGAIDFMALLKSNLLPLIMIGVSLVLSIVITIIYNMGIKSHLYAKYATKIMKSQNNRRAQMAGMNDSMGMGQQPMMANNQQMAQMPQPMVQPYVQPVIMPPYVQNQQPMMPQQNVQPPMVETQNNYNGGYIPSPHRDVNIPEKAPTPAYQEPVQKQNKGLPAELSSIGGHAFSQNNNLEIAVIPNGIKEIGPSAFSNCQNLKVVSIPPTVTKIGYNAFFGCRKLARINYGGRKSDWKNIKRGSNWLSSSGTTTVICVDGAISVNPYH